MNETPYFATPEREQRQQLLIHLINNAQEIPYLRAPAGAGKTRFAHEMAEELEPDYELVWLSADTELPLQDRLPQDFQHPEAEESEVSLLVQEEPDKPRLLLVDDAELLQPTELQELVALQRSGARLVLFGTGGLVQTEGSPGIQPVDLPPFIEEQSRSFIQAQGKLGPGGVDERMAVGLHRASGGLPGPLLDALATIPVIGQAPVSNKPRFSWPLVIAGLALAGLLVAVLAFQEQINRWFESVDDRQPVEIARSTAVDVAPPSPVEVPESEPVLPESVIVHEPPLMAEIPLQTAGPEVATEPARAEPGPSVAEETDQAVQDLLAPDLAPPLSVEQPGPEKAEPPKSGAPDPVLDAVIDAAITAAEQPPEPKIEPVTVPAVAPSEVPVVATGKEPEIVTEAPALPKPPPAKPTKAMTPVSAREGASPPASSTGSSAAKTGLAWLRAQPKDHYTLQLVGARDRAAIDKFIRRQDLLPPYAVYSRDLGGKPWYALVAGSYRARDAAEAARNKRFKALKGVWPRTFASIHEQLAAR